MEIFKLAYLEGHERRDFKKKQQQKTKTPIMTHRQLDHTRRERLYIYIEV